MNKGIINKNNSGNFTNRISLLIVSVGCLLLLAIGCVPISVMQSAKTVGKGGMEVTPSFSSFSPDDDSRGGATIGLQLGIGLDDNVDFQFGFGRTIFDAASHSDIKDNLYTVAFGPKFGIISGRLAFSAPIGFVFGDNSSVRRSIHVQPTLIFSSIPSKYLQFNGSAKILLLVENPSYPLLALNFGPAISRNLRKWAIRPEAGILVNLREEGYIRYFSLGFTVYK